MRFIDRLDALKDAQPNATQAQPRSKDEPESKPEIQPEVIEEKAWCERGDSNPHGFTRQILSLVRLPIPPLSHYEINHLAASKTLASGFVTDKCSGCRSEVHDRECWPARLGIKSSVWIAPSLAIALAIVFATQCTYV